MKKFKQIATLHSVHQAPDNGETVEFNPPGLVWLAEEGVTSYHVVVKDASGSTIVDTEVGRNIYRFSDLLQPGTYFWNVFADDAELGERSFSIAEDARPFIPPTAKELLDKVTGEHPRLRFSREEIAAYRERFAEELKVLRRNVADTLKRPIMELPDYYTSKKTMDIRGAIDRAREFLDRDTVACALVYLFDGDKEAGERARNNVLEVMKWNPIGYCSVLGTMGIDEVGESICRTMPSIVDWTWDLYSPREQNMIGETLAIHARDNYRRLTQFHDFLANPGNSHLGRQPGYLGEAALVLHEYLGRETAEKYLQYALDIYSSLFPYYGGRGGGWVEGVFYGSSYTKWYLPFFFAVEHLSGFSFLAKPFYRHLAEFFVHFAPPGQEVHPFGDGNWDTSVEWPGFQAQDPFGVYADRFGPETARNYSKQLRAGVETYNLHLLDLMYPIGKAQENRHPASKSFLCRDTGFISMRKDPEDPAKDIAVQTRCTSRYPASSHQHSDQGGLIVLAGGKGLITGSGTFGYVFAEEHHAKWTRQTVAHNCLMIDGEGQPRMDASAVATLSSFDGTTAVMDLSGVYPMLTSYCRTITYDRESGTVKVIDEVTAPKKVTVDFRLHSNYEPQLLANGNVLVACGGNRAEITASGEYSMTDIYEYNGYISRPGERHHFKQYHMNWRTADVQELRLETVIRVTAD